MALRIAVGVFAALRAVLIYGEVERLSTQPIVPPSLRPAAPRAAARAPASSA